MIDVDAGYELFWNNAVVTSALGGGVRFREAFDCRFNGLRVTNCGEHHGKQLTATMTSGSATVTVSSTAGVFKNQKVFGCGLDNVLVSSITNSTTMVLSKTMTFTGARPIVMEAKAAVHVCNNNNSIATSNNQYYTGARIEGSNSTGLRIMGQNNVDNWFSQCKIESNIFSLDYVMDIESSVACKALPIWLYASPYRIDYMQWAVTTAGTTLASILASRLGNFTLPIFYTSNGTMTSGSKVVTGIADTSSLTVGQRVVGTAIADDGIYHVCIQSIDSPTQITMTKNATASDAGTKPLTFRYYMNSGNFNRRYFWTGMPIIGYDADDPRNRFFAKLVDCDVAATGNTVLHIHWII